MKLQVLWCFNGNSACLYRGVFLNREKAYVLKSPNFALYRALKQNRWIYFQNCLSTLKTARKGFWDGVSTFKNLFLGKISYLGAIIPFFPPIIQKFDVIRFSFSILFFGAFSAEKEFLVFFSQPTDPPRLARACLLVCFIYCLYIILYCFRPQKKIDVSINLGNQTQVFYG